MITVPINLPQNSYEIFIGNGLIPMAVKYIADHAYREVVVVSDEHVWKLYGNTLEKELKIAEIPFTPIVTLPGENSKCLATLEDLYQQFANAKLDRNGLVIAFGGGVTGDLAGFAAATWMRGVDYIQLPTTLLAQIDSSVGGKTAINLKAGKNLAGAFHQPRLVIADTDFLQTLPPREMQCGLAEMIKYGAIFSDDLLNALAAPPDMHKLPELIGICCRMKGRVVEADERDSGQRMLLNFGHSFGHAIEKLGDYTLHNHGEAVAMGMVLAAGFGEKSGFSKKGCRNYLEKILAGQNLDIHCPYSASQLLNAMTLDKKGRKGGMDLILLRDIGQAEIVWHPMEQIEQILLEVV